MKSLQGDQFPHEKIVATSNELLNKVKLQGHHISDLSDNLSVTLQQATFAQKSLSMINSTWKKVGYALGWIGLGSRGHKGDQKQKESGLQEIQRNKATPNLFEASQDAQNPNNHQLKQSNYSSSNYYSIMDSKAAAMLVTVKKLNQNHNQLNRQLKDQNKDLDRNIDKMDIVKDKTTNSIAQMRRII